MSDAVEITRLPSGLLVVTESMSRVETVSIGAYVAAGTRNEEAADNGASHFLEHMAFKGTRHPARCRGRRSQWYRCRLSKAFHRRCGPIAVAPRFHRSTRWFHQRWR